MTEFCFQLNETSKIYPDFGGRRPYVLKKHKIGESSCWEKKHAEKKLCVACCAIDRVDPTQDCEVTANKF